MHLPSLLGQSPIRRVEVDSALSASAPNMAQYDDPVTEVTKPRPLNIAYVKSLVGVSQVLEQALVASEQGGLSAKHDPKIPCHLTSGSNSSRKAS